MGFLEMISGIMEICYMHLVWNMLYALVWRANRNYRSNGLVLIWIWIRDLLMRSGYNLGKTGIWESHCVDSNKELFQGLYGKITSEEKENSEVLLYVLYWLPI